MWNSATWPSNGAASFPALTSLVLELLTGLVSNHESRCVQVVGAEVAQGVRNRTWDISIVEGRLGRMEAGGLVPKLGPP